MDKTQRRKERREGWMDEWREQEEMIIQMNQMKKETSMLFCNGSNGVSVCNEREEGRFI